VIDEVLSFWFEQSGREQWWAKDADFDEAIRSRFGALHAAAGRGELHGWRDTADGRLAETVVLDQFSRNLYRDDSRAFANDGMALALAQEAVRRGDDQAVPVMRRQFFYMPFQHSESRKIHEIAVGLFASLGEPELLDYERRHKAIIDRFGRYPHRNRALGRPSTPEETAFLEEPGSSF